MSTTREVARQLYHNGMKILQKRCNSPASLRYNQGSPNVAEEPCQLLKFLRTLW